MVLTTNQKWPEILRGPLLGGSIHETRVPFYLAVPYAPIGAYIEASSELRKLKTWLYGPSLTAPQAPQTQDMVEGAGQFRQRQA